MKICLIVNSQIPQRIGTVRQITDFLIQHRQEVYVNPHIARQLSLPESPHYHIMESERSCAEVCEIVIAVGGDGTMLHTAMLIGELEKPVLGINVGKLGFLADTQTTEMDEALTRIINGDWHTEKRFVLQARLQDRTEFALNEFLFSKGSGVSMITLEVFCDGQKVNKYWADGLIVATPTGSTAYNLSAGGPIMLPETNVMVITPVCPHTLTTRPIVLPANRRIRVAATSAKQEILFSNDGKICNINDDIPLDVEISKGGYHINLIKLPGKNYFETLRTKLMWGKDLRE